MICYINKQGDGFILDPSNILSIAHWKISKGDAKEKIIITDKYQRDTIIEWVPVEYCHCFIKFLLQYMMFTSTYEPLQWSDFENYKKEQIQ